MKGTGEPSLVSDEIQWFGKAETSSEQVGGGMVEEWITGVGASGGDGEKREQSDDERQRGRRHPEHHERGCATIAKNESSSEEFDRGTDQGSEGNDGDDGPHEERELRTNQLAGDPMFIEGDSLDMLTSEKVDDGTTQKKCTERAVDRQSSLGVEGRRCGRWASLLQEPNHDERGQHECAGDLSERIETTDEHEGGKNSIAGREMLVDDDRETESKPPDAVDDEQESNSESACATGAVHDRGHGDGRHRHDHAIDPYAEPGRFVEITDEDGDVGESDDPEQSNGATNRECDDSATDPTPE